jgi:GH18 family chitinase
MKTVGYVVSWIPNIAVQYNKLTHINYAFTIPDAVGNLTKNPENPGWLQTVVSNAHANGGKVLISVGGWLPDSPNPASFASIAANSGYRSTFRNNLINLVNAYGLDGVDIDWEYPCPGGNGGNYATLMSELAGDMHSRGKLLSAAVAAFGANGDCVGTSVFNSVDHLNLMVYDIRDPNHSDYADAVNSINYWKGKGLAASKAILGLPFYSHPNWTAYNTLVAQNSANACRDNDGVNYWNGLPTIRSKSSYARANAGGVMMWEASQDASGANSATTAMYEAVNGLARSGNCP